MPAIVKGVAVETEPVGVMIVTSPVVAVGGTVATTLEGVTLTIVADAPLKETVVTPPPKPVPVNTTWSPGNPSCGEKLRMDNESAASLRIAVMLPAASYS
jgi:hypothetical protein